MPRALRSELPDGIFHVTARAVACSLLFEDDEDRRRFVWLLAQLTSRLRIRCLAYCLMGTHYHLLFEGTAEDLRLLMQRLNSRYAQGFNERHLRHGHVFAERYSVWLVRDEAHLERTRAYIEANPWQAGLCDPGEPWPWTWFAASETDGRNGCVPLPTAA